MSFRLKLVLSITLVSSMVLFSAGANRLTLIQAFLSERKITRLENMAAIYANWIIFTADYTREIQAAIDRRPPDINLITITNSAGIVLISTNRTLVGRRNPIPDSTVPGEERGELFIRSFPLIEGMTLQIGISMAGYRKDLGRARRWSLFLSFFGLFIILVTSNLVSIILEKPLWMMRLFANRVAAGDFSQRLSVTSRDSIGQLGSELNQMASQLNTLTSEMDHQIKLRTAELETTNKKLRELNLKKDEFISIVAHELKTPLTSMVGFSKTLMRLDLPESRQQEMIKIINSESMRLATLINEYLDISRIEFGDGIELQKESTDIGALAAEVALMLDPMRINNISVDIPKDFPRVSADKERIRRVLINLLGNALKYGTGKKSVTAAEETDHISVSVKDEGPGISGEEALQIFNKFYRIDDTGEGLGLGLPIAKSLVEAHGGRIWAEGHPGKGTVFTFTLPKTDEKKNSHS